MESNEESLFEKAMARYKDGTSADELIKDFQTITTTVPQQAAGWTCLAWLQLLCDQNQSALRSAKTAVKLNNLTKTIRWQGGTPTPGVGNTASYDVFSFTGINTIGSGTTTANYEVLGIVNGNYAVY